MKERQICKRKRFHYPLKCLHIHFVRGMTIMSYWIYPSCFFSSYLKFFMCIKLILNLRENHLIVILFVIGILIIQLFFILGDNWIAIFQWKFIEFNFFVGCGRNIVCVMFNMIKDSCCFREWLFLRLSLLWRTIWRNVVLFFDYHGIFLIEISCLFSFLFDFFCWFFH